MARAPATTPTRADSSLAGEDRTRCLLPYLLSAAGPSPAFVRIVDKHLVLVQADAYTTYVDSNAREALKKGVASGVVEYVQGNLLTEGELRLARAIERCARHRWGVALGEESARHTRRGGRHRAASRHRPLAWIVETRQAAREAWLDRLLT